MPNTPSRLAVGRLAYKARFGKGADRDEARSELAKLKRPPVPEHDPLRGTQLGEAPSFDSTTTTD